MVPQSQTDSSTESTESTESTDDVPQTSNVSRTPETAVNREFDSPAPPKLYNCALTFCRRMQAALDCVNILVGPHFPHAAAFLV